MLLKNIKQFVFKLQYDKCKNNKYLQEKISNLNKGNKKHVSKFKKVLVLEYLSTKFY